MHFGLNFTLGPTLDIVHRLVAEKKIDYCELLIDNFLQVPPESIADAFDCPVGFHIMFSKFIENDEASLEQMAQRLRRYIEVLQPLYVSDHIARFTHKGRQLYHLAEPDYRHEYPLIRDRVARWQDQLGQRLFLENYPSIMDNGMDAPWFFERICQDTGAGTLFDASNAICSLHNCGTPLAAWEELIDDTPHFHVAGYKNSMLEPYVLLDTHDCALAEDTLDFLTQYRERFDKPGATLTYERDDDIEYTAIADDLDKLHQLFNQPLPQPRNENAFENPHYR